MHLMIGSDRRRPTQAWWLYFALVLALAIMSLIGTRSPLDLANSIVNAFGLVGLWGYIRQVAVGHRLFWAGYFAVSVLLSAIATALNVADAAPAVVLAFALTFVLPLYYALWQYAFRSPGAWRVADA
jgi:hypothetical protein